MTCGACGQSNPPNARFCDGCGRQLSTPAPNRRAWQVGSDSACDVVVSSPVVSGRHCRVVDLSDGLSIEDLGSTNGTFVNGQRVAGPVRIQRGDLITLGQTVPIPTPVPWDGHLEARTSIRIGREPDNDVILDYPMISAHHARITLGPPGAIIEDLGSMNGTSIGSLGHKIKTSPLSPGDTVYFGSFRIPAARLLDGPMALGTRAHTTLRLPGDQMVLGRDPGCQHVLDYPMVSWQHARLLRAEGTVVVEDLNSTNGTYVNGHRVSSPTTVNAGDVIGLGSYTFALTARGTLEKRDFRHNVTIEAQRVCVDVPARRLLEDISLTLYPSELVGLMGPSGAGKSSLMGTLNGYSHPSGGMVMCNGVDLYRNYEQFAGQFGYVPQDDIMHGDLTVSEALYFTARLRLPTDYKETDIKARIQQVLAQLGLEGTEDVLIGSPSRKGISGGQRKRVNLAMELLTDPSVLFLDEPTSGLSSEDALLVMNVIRGLADAGKTILITIHQPSTEVFRLMDSLVLLSRDPRASTPARLVYFGPAYPDSVHFFNPPSQVDRHVDVSPDRVLRGLAKKTTEEWVRLYADSMYKRLYVDARAGQLLPGPQTPGPPKPRRRVGLTQWWTLVRRGTRIKLSDRWNTFILLSQAPIIGALIAVVFGVGSRERSSSVTMATTVFLLVVAAIWFGCSNSAREIVAEWPIYKRERMVNLKIPTYVASKLALLGALCAVQCATLLGIVYWCCGLHGDWLRMLGVLCLASFAGLGLGLALSALARTSEVAVSLLPLVLLPLVILGGMMQPLPNMHAAMKAVTHPIPTRWAFEGLLLLESDKRERAAAPAPANLGMAQVTVTRVVDSYFPEGDRQGVGASVGVLGGMLIGLIAVVLVILRKRDVH